MQMASKCIHARAMLCNTCCEWWLAQLMPIKVNTCHHSWCTSVGHGAHGTWHGSLSCKLMWSSPCSHSMLIQCRTCCEKRGVKSLQHLWCHQGSLGTLQQKLVVLNCCQGPPLAGSYSSHTQPMVMANTSVES